MKQIKWACIYQEIEFDSEEELEEYLSKVNGWYILEKKELLEGGRAKIVIRKQYNNCPLTNDNVEKSRNKMRR